MKIIVQHQYHTLNVYDVIANNGTTLCRQNIKHDFNDFKTEAVYIATGYVNGNLLSINCADYQSAKKLFKAMANEH